MTIQISFGWPTNLLLILRLVCWATSSALAGRPGATLTEIPGSNVVQVDIADPQHYGRTGGFQQIGRAHV